MWGKNKSGSKRFYCLTCKQSFTRKRPDISKLNRFSWFKRWLKGSSIEQIADSGRKSSITIRRAIHWYLNCLPKPNPCPNLNCYPVIDATWFGRKHCLLVYWDKALTKAQWWRWSERKEAAWEIIEDLESLKKKRIIFKAATTDGAPGIKTALDYVYPHIPKQRCLVHLQRMGLAFLTQRPKTLAGLQLRNIILRLNRIKTHDEHYFWQKEFYSWCNRYYAFLKQKSYSFEKKNWWYTHKSLRKTRRMIINALPDMWHYLDNRNISKDTNGLEGRWGSLKGHFCNHKGLSKSRRKAYLSWYLTVVINKELPTRFDH